MSTSDYELPPIPAGPVLLGQIPESQDMVSPPSLLVVIIEHAKNGMEPLLVLDSRDPDDVRWAIEFYRTQYDVDVPRYDFTKMRIVEVPYYPIAALEHMERAVLGAAWSGDLLEDTDSTRAPGKTKYDALTFHTSESVGECIILPQLLVWGSRRAGSDEMVPGFVSDAEHRNDVARVMELHGRHVGWPEWEHARNGELCFSFRLQHKAKIDAFMNTRDDDPEEPAPFR